MRTFDTTHRVGIYGWTHTHGYAGVDHYRVVEPLRVAAAMGTNAFTGRVLSNDILEQVDHVIAHQIHGEADTQAWAELAAAGSHKLIIDVDDWMWGPDYTPFKEHYTPEVLDRLYANVSRAHVVTTPSPKIGEYLASFNPNVWIVPNTVPAWLCDWDMPERDRPTVGWQLSPSHIRDFTAPVGRQLAYFLRDNPAWVLHGYGAVAELDDRGGRLRQTPWVGNVEQMYRQISMDIGIGPLRPTPFNRAKSSLRAVEYAALGIVAVLPDLEPYRGWVNDGKTGRLVGAHETLRGVLAELAADPDAIADMSKNARELARAAFTTETGIYAWAEAWASQP